MIRTENSYTSCIIGGSISEIETIEECQNNNGWVPVPECFGHELEGWLSKQVNLFEQVFIDLNKYSDKCLYCKSPSYNGSLFGFIDCSNKNCGKENV